MIVYSINFFTNNGYIENNTYENVQMCKKLFLKKIEILFIICKRYIHLINYYNMDHEQNTNSNFKNEKKKHMKGWNKDIHYTDLGCFCGQSCPCCRSEQGELWGVCSICSKVDEYNKL